MSTGTLPSVWPVWVWYEYKNAPDRYIQLNLQALRRQAPASHFNIILVNRSNIASYVPDLPDAFWRLPKPVAFSDAGRLALLATHGGIYLDADFLVLRSLRAHCRAPAACGCGRLSFFAAARECGATRKVRDHRPSFGQLSSSTTQFVSLPTSLGHSPRVVAT